MSYFFHPAAEAEYLESIAFYESERPTLTAPDVLARYVAEQLPEFVGLCLSDVNQVGNFGDTPLNVAAVHGRLDEVEALLDAGARIDARGELGNTALHEALGQNHSAVIEALLARGASLLQANDRGATPLDLIREKRDPYLLACLGEIHSAAQAGDSDRLYRLLSQGYPVDDFDDLGRTPLHYAARHGHTDAAAVLLAAGADVNAHDERTAGDTPLGEAAATCSVEMAALLLDAGADPTIPGWMQLTALDRACGGKRGDGRAVCELLRRAANARPGRTLLSDPGGRGKSP